MVNRNSAHRPNCATLKGVCVPNLSQVAMCVIPRFSPLLFTLAYAVPVFVALPEPAWAAQVSLDILSPRDQQAAAQSAVHQALYAAAATREAEKRLIDNESIATRKQLGAQRERISRLQDKLTKARADNAAGKAAVATLRIQLAQAQESYIKALAERDRDYEREITQFRRSIQGIAATPEDAQLLERYNSGDRSGATNAMRKLADERYEAQQVRLTIERAAQLRPIAMLSLDTLRHQTIDQKVADATSTGKVIEMFEEIVSIDAKEHRDWVELAKLYRTTGRLLDAERAALSAVRYAKDDVDRGRAHVEVGEILLALGNTSGASSHFQDSLDIRIEVHDADPQTPWKWRDVSESRMHIGNVHLKQGDLKTAHNYFQDSYQIAQRLSTADPNPDAGADSPKRYVYRAALRLGNVLFRQRKFVDARGMYETAKRVTSELMHAKNNAIEPSIDHSRCLALLGELEEKDEQYSSAIQHFQQSLEIRRKAADRNHDSAEYQILLAQALDMLANAHVRQDRRDTARSLYLESHGIMERLVKATPNSVDAKSGLSISLVRLGDMFASDGEIGIAEANYKRSLQIRTELANKDQRSAKFSRDLSIGLDRQGDVLANARDYDQARAKYQESLAIRQTLARISPSWMDLIQDQFVSQIKLGDVALLTGNIEDSESHYRMGLDIAHKLAKQVERSAEAQRDIWVAMSRLARIEKSGVTWAAAVEKMVENKRRHTFASEDEEVFEDAQRRAAEQIGQTRTQ